MAQFLFPVALAALCAGLAGCGGGGSGSSDAAASAAPTRLTGVAASGGPMAGAQITACDSSGARRSTTAGPDGHYTLDVSGLAAPLLLAATDGPLQPLNGVLQPLRGTRAYAALLPRLQPGRDNAAQVNPLTDKIASDVARAELDLPGSVPLITACRPSSISAAAIARETAALRGLLLDALRAEGVEAPERFDPVSTAMQADHHGVDAVLDRLHHARDGWSSGSDTQLRATRLYDLEMQEISADNRPLDPALPPWSAARRRIFVVGDSTASNYGAAVAPRMGWGQVLGRRLKAGSGARVINLAQSGRSSRSFITEGWLRLLAEQLQPGDHLLIQFGHNDEKCDLTGSLDWINRCTYPNDAQGRVQLPATLAGLPPGTTADDLSFQRSLEKYMALARSRGAVPVLLTPVTRIVQDKTVASHVEGAFPIARSTHVTTRGDRPGDYSATVRQAGDANQVPVIDLDALSIDFFNRLGVGSGGPEARGGWRDHYLAVWDTGRHPFYASATTVGHYLNADRTHFQEAGAVAVADLVLQGVRSDPRLAGLAALLD
ncbi:rhamnogalacturonan acetylesterase [Eleftheria terrae]|uniref:rhamnogalacturonan acetylesterase n=1 Tax=Eleftheria terrae TaxID=1597781 RepID=UPI00263BAFF9|nr:rhamnogalacturonan acetylesterase [Eleftheria terrae]WKB53342.1 rhamnogalacturonan acetylesterase [Eleftheria terrae]